MSQIYDIKAYINAYAESLIKFDPEKKSYSIEVPPDCFALKLHIDYDPAYYISVRADKDAGRYESDYLDESMGDYHAGNEVPWYEYYDGYIVRLDKRSFSLNEDLTVNITITASSGQYGSYSWNITLKRPCEKDIRGLFKKDEYKDSEFNVTLPYALYTPRKMDSSKKYPLVVCLHGTGECVEPFDSILEKTAMATCWVRDSEDGRHPCIVLVPQCIVHYDENDNWTSLVQFSKGKSNSPFWPLPQLKAVWNLIKKTAEAFPVDRNRIYLTGISSGGFGAYVLSEEHPGVFAGLIAVSAAFNPEKVTFLKNLPLWIVHSDDDPLIVPSWSLEPCLSALNKNGVSYRLTRYPKQRIFWQHGHFAWEACYHDSEIRDWLFKQSLKTPEDPKTPVDAKPEKETKTGKAVTKQSQSSHKAATK